MGATQTQQIVSGAAAAAGSGVAIASATGALAPLAATLGVSVPALGAIIGAGIMIAAEAIDLIMNSGCGQTCIVTTGFANQANAALQQNIAAFFAPRMVSGTYDPSIPLKKSSQLACLSNFDIFWAWLQAPGQCGNPALGSAGQRCITDRQAGACTWHQTADVVPPWGIPPVGSCWNWFNGYRDPIANDPNIYDDTAVSVSNAATGVTNVLSSLVPAGLPSWALPAGVLAALLLVAVVK